MIRTIITPKTSNIKIAIPDEYVGKPLEITYISLEELEKNASKKTMGDFWGIISDETAKIMHDEVYQNRKEW
ncbi:MAG: hypothetical protein ABI359_01135 [Ginsengibacter sp.]